MPPDRERQARLRSDREIVHLDRMTEPGLREAVGQDRHTLGGATGQAVLEQGDHQRGVTESLHLRRIRGATTGDPPVEVGEGANLVTRLEQLASRAQPHMSRPRQGLVIARGPQEMRDGIGHLPEPGVDLLIEPHQLVESDEEGRRIITGVYGTIQQQLAAGEAHRPGQTMSVATRWELDTAECRDLGLPPSGHPIPVGQRREVDWSGIAAMRERHLESSAVGQREHRWITVDRDAGGKPHRRKTSGHQIAPIEDDSNRRLRLVVEGDDRMAPTIGH